MCERNLLNSFPKCWRILLFLQLSLPKRTGSAFTTSALSYKPCLPSHSFIFKNHCFRCVDFDKRVTSDIANLCDFYKDMKEEFAANTTIVSRNYYPSFQANISCIKSFPCMESPTDIINTIRTLRSNKGMSFLNARNLRVVTIERAPFSTVSNFTYKGVIFEFLSALSSKYNFTMNIFLPEDGNWGAKMKDGTWNGMLGLIKENRADLGAASFSVTLERIEAVDFTVAFHQEPSAILIPPPHEKEKLSVLVRPLSKEVWLAVFFTVAILAPTMFFFHILSLKISGEDGELENANLFHIIGRLFNFLVGSLVQESVTSPANKTTRFLVALWWMITLTIANVYIAFLMSYLSTPKLFNLVDDLDGLSHQKVVKWTFRKNAALQDLFMSDNSLGVYKSIGDGVRENDLVLTDHDGVAQVLSGKHAFIKEKSFLDVAISQDYNKTKQCRFTLAKETFFSVGVALAVQRQSPIIEVLNSEIISLISTGIMEKFKKMHWPNDLWCADAATYLVATRPRTRKLSLDDTQGAYFLWSCGITFGLLFFASEMIYGFFKSYNKKRRTYSKGLILPFKNSGCECDGYSWVV